MKKSETISERLVRLREERNLTQAEIGRLVGVSKNYIYLIESGSKVPAEKFVRKLDHFETGASNSPMAVNEESAPYKSSRPVSWSGVTTDRLEALLRACEDEKDWLAVERVARELAERKMKERMGL
jgi:transcriptional regulator with XRE-family HTH domain